MTLPEFVAGLINGRALSYAGVVHEDVRPTAELIANLRKHPLHACSISDVTRNRSRNSSTGANLVSDSFNLIKTAGRNHHA